MSASKESRSIYERKQSVQLRLSELQAERERVEAAIRATTIREMQIDAEIERSPTIPAPPPASMGAE